VAEWKILMSETNGLGENLVFLISLPRSGSTLLQRILNCHTQIHSTAEPWIMLLPTYARRSTGLSAEYDAELARQGLEDFIKSLPDGDEAFDSAVRSYAEALYHAALKSSGKALFLDKTPRYWHVLPELKKLFPHARFIYLLRNPLAIAASVIRTWFNGDPDRLEGTTHAQDLYEGPAAIGAAISNPGARDFVVRYEELVADPETVLHAVCAFLQMKFEPDMIEYGGKASPFGRHGDTTSIEHHATAVTTYRDTWCEFFSSERGHRFASEYLDQLGAGTLALWKYDRQTLFSRLERERHACGSEFISLSEEARQSNAEGEVLVASGRLAEAREIFQQVIHDHPGFVTAYNNLAVVSWELGDAAGAIDALRRGLEKDNLDGDLLRNGAQMLAALGMRVDALLLCNRCIEHFPDDMSVSRLRDEIVETMHAANKWEAEPSQLTQELTVSASKQTVLIATSIAPFGIEKQRKAIQSWVSQGFDVISLNIPREIEELSIHFPDVRFVRATRDGRQRAGKPYVFVDDLLAVLENSEHDIVGIVNSDIVIGATLGLRAYLADKVRGGLLYGSRTDVDDLDDPHGHLYHRGFDFFFFERSAIAELPSSDFMLGVPWWDYWLPAAFCMKERTISRLDSSAFLHKKHGANYSAQLLVQFGDAFAERCAALPFVNLFHQCENLEVGNARYGVLADAALDYLSRVSRKISLRSAPARSAGDEGLQYQRPRVSAIVSTYNSENFIEGCLLNLSAQSIADQIEIIVIDAASPQDEKTIVERFQRTHPACQIRYERTNTRIGVYAAWNLAAGLAQGDYLITCSTNDRLRLDACEILSRALDENPDVSLVYGNSFLTRIPHESFDSATLAGLYVWPEYSYKSLTEVCMVGPHPMWRRSVHEESGYFDETLVALGDQEFWLRLGETHNIRGLPDFTGLYYVSKDSVTGDLDLVQKETDRVQSYYQSRFRFREWSRRRQRWVADSESASRVRLAMFVRCSEADLDALADTLDALSNLAAPGWTLTVMSPLSCPDQAFVLESRLDWLTYQHDGEFVAVRDRAMRSSSAEWVTILDAGDSVEPTLMHDLEAYLRKQPNVRFIYSDEEECCSADKTVSVLLKPDWNLELQRSGVYVGKLCLVERKALAEIGGVGQFRYECNADILYRMWEAFGDNAIGHISEVLVTYEAQLAKQNLLPARMQERKEILERHLFRCRSNAMIRENCVAGTFHVQYALTDEPLVSVLILAESNAGNLHRCMRSILERTDYGSFEIVVGVVMQLMEPTERFIETSFAGCQRVRVVAVPGDVAVPTQLNCLGEQARGRVLAFMRDQMVSVQPQWLRELVSHCTRPGIGLVGARVVNQRRGLVHVGIGLGLGNDAVGARVNEGMHLSSPGYMNVNQVSREVGAVSSLCMMTTAEVFAKTNGFSSALSIPLYRDIDFSQRVRVLGKKILWTPHATLMFSGEQREVDGHARSREHLREEAEYLHTHWLQVLAADPMSHVQLGLRSQRFGLDIDMSCGWNPDLDMEPRIIAAGAGSPGSWYYRGAQPMKWLSSEKLAHCTVLEFPAGRVPTMLPTIVDIKRMRPDTVLLHNTIHDVHLETMAAYRKHNNVFTVFGQDDLMFELPKSNPFFSTVYQDMKKRLRRCLDCADRLVVTTEPLAQALKGWIGDIQVIPNYLDAAVWTGLSSKRGASRKPRVGWAGATQHEGDLRLLEAVVKETADDVEWVFLGMCPSLIRPFVREFHAGVPLELYPAKLASLNLDLAVAPLEYNRFNEAKSNLRILEYGILALPVIATDIEPYRNGPVTLVKNNPRAWIKAIYDHVNDDCAARQAGEKLQEWVKSGWMLQSHLGEWLDALSPQTTRQPVSMETI